MGKAQGERFSVVFKQRTTPASTAPRYQEDYELATLQLASLDALRRNTEARKERRLSAAISSVLSVGVCAAALLYVIGSLVATRIATARPTKE